MNTKMTNREALTIALNLMTNIMNPDGYDFDEVKNAEAATKIQSMIASLDKKAENAKNKPRTVKADPEREERIAKITAYLEENPEGKTCKEIAEAIGETSAKVSGALGVMRERGIAGSHEGKTKSAPSVHFLKVNEEEEMAV